MPKRTTTERDSEEDFEDDPNPNRNPNDGNQISSELLSSVIHLLLEKELKERLIKKEHIMPLLKNSRANFNDVMIEAKKTLENIYGLKLEEVASNTHDKDFGHNKSSKSSYILVSSLKPESRAVLGEVWSNSKAVDFDRTPIGPDDYRERPNNTSGNGSIFSTAGSFKSRGVREFFLPTNVCNTVPTSSRELVKMGIMFVITTLIVLNDNRIREQELFNRLQSFGLTDNLNIRNSNYNLNLHELMNEFLRRDLLVKVLLGTSESDTIAEYSLGRRTFVELPPEALYRYIQVIYGEDFDSNIAERAFVTIERTYGKHIRDATLPTDNSLDVDNNSQVYTG